MILATAMNCEEPDERPGHRQAATRRCQRLPGRAGIAAAHRAGAREVRCPVAIRGGNSGVQHGLSIALSVVRDELDLTDMAAAVAEPPGLPGRSPAVPGTARCAGEVGCPAGLADAARRCLHPVSATDRRRAARLECDALAMGQGRDLSSARGAGGADGGMVHGRRASVDAGSQGVRGSVRCPAIAGQERRIRKFGMPRVRMGMQALTRLPSAPHCGPKWPGCHGRPFSSPVPQPAEEPRRGRYDRGATTSSARPCVPGQGVLGKVNHAQRGVNGFNRMGRSAATEPGTLGDIVF